MKKLLLTLSLALIAILANAKSTVYLRVDGTTVTTTGTWYVHYWGGASSVWPGVQMTLISDQADDGYRYFSYEIDTDGTYNIIFNQNGDTWKTGNIRNLSGDVAYTLNSSKGYTKLDAVPTWSTTPEPEPDPVTVYLQVDKTYVTSTSAPYLYAWNGSTKYLGDWPGKQMTLIEDAADDNYQYYSITVANAGSEFSMIFKAGRGKTQTGDIIGVKANCAYKLTGISSNDYTYEALSAIPTWTPKTPNNIYLKVDGTYVTETETPRLYAWKTDGTTTYEYHGAWSGVKMELVKDAATDGNKYYYATVENSGEAYNIIFNNGLGFTDDANARQSHDLKNLTGDVVYEIKGTHTYVKGECDMTAMGAVKGLCWDASVMTAVPTWEDKTKGTNKVDLRGVANEWAENSAKFTYDADNDYYYYNVINVAGLAQDFLVYIDDFSYTASAYKNVNVTAATDYNTVSRAAYGDNMSVTNAADFADVTIYVKQVGDEWQMKVEPITMTISGAEDAAWNGKAFKKTSDGNYVLQLETTDLDKLGSEGFVISRDGTSISSGSALTPGITGQSDANYVEMTEGNTTNMTAEVSDEYDGVFFNLKKDSEGKWYIYVTTYNTSGVNTINASDVKIFANAGEIVVEGAQKVAVYTVGGALVSTDARTQVARGLYIVRADNQVKKVVVK